MDGLGKLLEILEPRKVKYNEQCDGLEVSEIISQGNSIKYQSRRIPNGDVVPWLNQRETIGDGKKSDHDGEIIRVVWVPFKVTILTEFDINEESLNLILKDFEVKKMFSLVADGTIISWPIKDYGEVRNKQCFALGIFGYCGVLIWTHDLTTSQTKAVWCGSDSEMLPFALIRQVLEHLKDLARHPMFMALVAVTSISQVARAMIETIRDQINEVENRTRHCPPGLLRCRNIVGSYTCMSATMSGCATRLVYFQTQIQLSREIFDEILGYIWPHGVERPQGAEKVAREIDDCISLLQKRLEGKERRIRYLSQRANAQLTAVSNLTASHPKHPAKAKLSKTKVKKPTLIFGVQLFHLISQQETQLSISVAEDSRMLALATKDDSTAMRTLAAVTIIFLPGTFVAAFFAMPLFHWETAPTAGHSIMTRQFWLYWAVTLPLTLVTVGSWLLWMRLQARRRRVRDSEWGGREALHREVTKSPGSRELVTQKLKEV